MEKLTAGSQVAGQQDVLEATLFVDDPKTGNP